MCVILIVVKSVIPILRSGFMSQFKTAISIDHSVFQQMDALARSLHMSRSQVFEIAAREFLRAYKDQKVTEQLNKVYSGSVDEDDYQLLKALKPRYRKILEDAD